MVTQKLEILVIKIRLFAGPLKMLQVAYTGSRYALIAIIIFGDYEYIYGSIINIRLNTLILAHACP